MLTHSTFPTETSGGNSPEAQDFQLCLQTQIPKESQTHQQDLGQIPFHSLGFNVLNYENQGVRLDLGSKNLKKNPTLLISIF